MRGPVLPPQRGSFGGTEVYEHYAFGSNGSLQLGLGHDRDISSPEVVLLRTEGLDPIQTFINSGNATIILLQDSSSDFQVVQVVGRYNPEGPPLSAQFLRGLQIVKGAATWDAFAFVCTDENTPDGCHLIRTFGSPEKAQLGRPGELGSVPSLDNSTAAAVVRQGAVIQIAAGVQHFVAVLESDEGSNVVGWGNGRKGQLGEPAEAEVDKPRFIEGIDFKVVQVACGREFTVLLGEPEKGRIIVLGSDKFGVQSACPENVKGWKQIGAGWGSISILFEDGSIKSWGRNDHGQLAPTGLPPIDQIAVGSEHTIAITRARTGAPAEIIAWGWGEHGNCGPNVDASGDVKGRWNAITVPEKPEHASGNDADSRQPVGVAAGHATSWFWTKAKKID